MADKEANINYDFGDIHRYVNGEMTTKEMHDMERAALQDPFLADALEGYQNVNKQQAEKHLNEITAAVQSNQQKPEIIAVSKRKSYAWLAVASLIFFIGISIFIYQNKNNNKLAMETGSNAKSNKTRDSFYYKNNNPISQQKDSEITVMQDATIEAKTNKNESYTASILKRNERKRTESKKEDSMFIASAPATLSYRSRAMPAQSLSSTHADTLRNDSNDAQVVKGYTARSENMLSKNEWTTDKGKPFLLSEVEVVNMGNKTKKATDSSFVKPEGGWLLFQNYLFSKLSKKDSSAVTNRLNNNSNLEIEFSVSETGLPYDIQVLHAPDSTTANKAVTAIEQGPKWISTDKKEKRFNLKF